MTQADFVPAPFLTVAVAADLPCLLPLVRAYHAFEGIELNDTRRRATLAALLADPTLGRVWLIESDRTVVGYVALTCGYSIEFGGRDGFVDELFIVEAARGRGCGSAVLAQVSTLAATLGIRALHLEVAHDNPRARRLYEHAGFVARDHFQWMSMRLAAD